MKAIPYLSTKSKLSNTNSIYYFSITSFKKLSIEPLTINTFFSVVLTKNKLELTIIYF